MVITMKISLTNSTRKVYSIEESLKMLKDAGFDGVDFQIFGEAQEALDRPDYLESLFQGIDIILEKRLDQVSFDTTIICTITDASNSKNGEYRVTDGNVTYKAYSDLDSYVAG